MRAGARGLLAVWLLGAWLGAAAPTAGQGVPSLTVFAAADLAFAFRELVPRFEQAAGAKVTLVLGSTGNLAWQIEHGGPADVFFAADERFVDRLAARGVLMPETRALLDPRVRHVAIANPAHAPYGLRAEEALRSVGVWEALRPKLVYGETIRHTLQFLQSGAAEAGLVARSIAEVPEIDWAPIDPSLHRPLNQAVAVVARSPRRDLAKSFIRFVNGPEGREVMRRHGFLLPGEL